MVRIVDIEYVYGLECLPAPMHQAGLKCYLQRAFQPLTPPGQADVARQRRVLGQDGPADGHQLNVTVLDLSWGGTPRKSS